MFRRERWSLRAACGRRVRRFTPCSKKEHSLKCTSSPPMKIFHFYLSDPVEMLQLQPSGCSQVFTLGPDLKAGQRVQLVVPAGVWQGMRLVEGGQSGAARVHGDTGLRLCRLPQRELCGVGRTVARGGGADRKADADLGSQRVSRLASQQVSEPAGQQIPE